MKVSDILRIKGNTLYTITPDTSLYTAITIMAEHDIGSLVVMESGKLIGMLTFYELLKHIATNETSLQSVNASSAMKVSPMTCTAHAEINEVRRLMLSHHIRYLPVLDHHTLMGIISFYDVAKAIVDAQDFENKMLKAYIHDWPVEAMQN